jgi:phage I-like protein
MQLERTVQLAEVGGDTLAFHVDLTGMQFSSAQGVWLQYLPLGTYEHPLHGTIDITPAKVANLVRNFNENVREQDLDVDYEHKLLDTKAAGWIRAAEDRGEKGLWVRVDFTGPAYQALKAGEYRYFSAEFANEWMHPKTKMKHKDVMFGGALTNRPFIKDIMPINLSDIVVSKPPKTGGSMDPKLKAGLIKLYKLSETATDEEVQAAVEGGAPPVEETDEAKAARLKAEKDAVDEQARKDAEEAARKTTEEMTASLSELAKTDPTVRLLLAEREAGNRRLDELSLAHKLSEATVKLNAMNETGKFAIPPAIRDEARDLVASLSEDAGGRVLALIGEMTKLGLVDLSEKGKSRTENGGKTPGETFTASVAKLAEDEKIGFAEAATRVALTDPDGFAAYREESYAGSRK